MKVTTRTLVFRICLALLLVLVSYLAFAPILNPIPRSDKFGHVGAFLALSLVADFSFPETRFGWTKMLTLLAYGVLIEVVQHFLPYRNFDLLDIASDAAGLLLYRAGLPFIRG